MENEGNQSVAKHTDVGLIDDKKFQDRSARVTRRVEHVRYHSTYAPTQYRPAKLLFSVQAISALPFDRPLVLSLQGHDSSSQCT